MNDAESAVALATEVCVIGSGVAGITTARRLIALGHNVVLLESGGLDHEAAIAELNAGENVGEFYYELDRARLRFFGGTAAIWGGRVVELDPIDLEKRDWVPHSGWPIRWDELQSYYEPARHIFGLTSGPTTAADIRAAGGWVPDFDRAKLDFGVWAFDNKYNRFLFDSSRDLIDHPRCTVITHATVTAIELARDGRRVVGLTARSLAGKTLAMSARIFVLAAGGLENPRLLLASRSVAANGIGNQHDQVGRFFMEHPHARGGHVVGGSDWRLLKTFNRAIGPGRKEMRGLVKPSADSQREHHILNGSLIIGARRPQGTRAFGRSAYARIKHSVAPTKKGRAIWQVTREMKKRARNLTDPLRPWLLRRLGARELALVVRAEQAPNPDSRVLLSDQRDALGMPRLALDWRLTALDVDSVRGLVDLLDGELRRLRLGRVELADWLKEPGGSWAFDTLVSAHPIGGFHHMGTTRMSDNPREGVTDRDGRVHGVENLYVVGSSVFPTSGWANPTLTIAALSLMTSDRLAPRLAEAAAS